MTRRDVDISIDRGIVTVVLGFPEEFSGSSHAEWRTDEDVPEFVGVFSVCRVADTFFVNGKATMPLSKLPDLVSYFKSRSMSIWQASRRLA